MNYPATLVLGFTEEDNFLLYSDWNGYLSVKDKISVQSIKKILLKYIRPEFEPTSLVPRYMIKVDMGGEIETWMFYQLIDAYEEMMKCY